MSNRLIIVLLIIIFLVTGCSFKDSDPESEGTAQMSEENELNVEESLQTREQNVVRSTKEDKPQFPILPDSVQENFVESNWQKVDGYELHINDTIVDLDEENNFIIDNLTIGTNEVNVVIRNSSNNQFFSQKEEVIYEPIPQIQLISPSSREIDKPTVTLVGKVFPKDSNLYVNGEKIRVSRDGIFDKKIRLGPGTTEIDIIAINDYGESDPLPIAERTFTYNPLVPNLIIETPEFISPQKKGDTYNRIEIVGLTEPSNLVQIFVNPEENNVDLKSLAYKGNVNTNGKFNSTIELSKGLNRILITATNSFGQRKTEVYEVFGKEFETD